MPPRARLCVVLVFLALGAWTIARHEWWRDEAYTWLVVENSPTLGDLFRNLGFNGHPKLYYVLQWWLPSTAAVSAVNLLFAAGAVALLCTSAPLGPWQKALFALGFFPLYQYGVIARCYSLLLFLFFLYCHLKATRRPWPLRAVVLALLAQVHLVAVAIAAVMLGLEWREGRAQPRWRVWAAVVIGSLALALLEIVPPGASGKASLRGSSQSFVRGLGHAFWPDFGIFRTMLPVEVAGVALFVASWWVFRARPRALRLYAMLCATLGALTLVIYGGHRWQHGFYFVYFLAAPWLAGERIEGNRFVTAVLVLHVLVGLYAVSDDLLRPYSDGEAVAQYIEDHGLGAEPLVGVQLRETDLPELRYSWDIDHSQSVLLRMPGKRMVNPVSHTSDPYWLHHGEANYFPIWDSRAMSGALEELARKLGRPYLVVLSLPAGPGSWAAPAPLEPVARFPTPSDFGEHLALYRYGSRLGRSAKAR